MAMQTDTTTTGVSDQKGFNQLGDRLEGAIDEVSVTRVSEVIERIRPGVSRAWSTTADYSRRHPYRIAITVVGLGALAAMFFKRGIAAASLKSSERQY